MKFEASSSAPLDSTTRPCLQPLRLYTCGRPTDFTGGVEASRKRPYYKNTYHGCLLALHPKLGAALRFSVFLCEIHGHCWHPCFCLTVALIKCDLQTSCLSAVKVLFKWLTQNLPEFRPGDGRDWKTSHLHTSYEHPLCLSGGGHKTKNIQGSPTQRLISPSIQRNRRK